MVKLALAATLAFAAWNARAVTSTWQVDVVDASGPGKYSSLKIDRDGNVHVAFIVDDGNRSPLKYAFWDHRLKKWFVMPVAEGAAACSLALDSQQHPHISFDDPGGGGKLRHAYWDGKSWVKEAIPLNSEVIAYYNSIAFDGQDHPNISFYEYRGAKDTDMKIRLRHVLWNGRYWEVRTVDGEAGSGKFNSMSTDPQGHLHIAYANVTAGTAGLRYAFWDGTSWKAEVVDGPGKNEADVVGYSVNVAIDSNANPHITYMDESIPMLKYAVRNKGVWTVEIVDRLSALAYPDRNGIALDENGQPYLTYYDAGRGILRLAHRQSQHWVTETLDSKGAGFTSSVEISGGEIWVSYADESGALKVAHQNLAEENASSAQQLIGTNDLKRADR
jgi:hypothetical protein